MKSYLNVPALVVALAFFCVKGTQAQAQFLYVTGVRNYKVRIVISWFEIKLRKLSVYCSGSGRDPNGLEAEEGQLLEISLICSDFAVSHVQRFG